MTYYQITGLIFKVLIIIIPFYLLLLKKNTLKYSCTVCLLCFASTFFYDFEILGMFTLQQILLVIIVLTQLCDKRVNAKKITDMKFCSFLYVAFVSVVTIFGYLFKSSYILKGSIIQNQLRPIVQIVFMIFSFLTYESISSFDKNTSLKILRKFYYATLFLAVVAIIQTLLFYFTGFDILPMRKDFISINKGLTAVAKNGLLRATSGVGEPKQLSKFLAIGFSLQLLFFKKLGYRTIQLEHLCLFIIAIYFTSSTTGYLLIATAVCFYFLKNYSKNFLLLPICLCAVLLTITLVMKTDVVADKFEEAKINNEIVGLENSDTATMRWLIDNPLYAITGVGLVNTVAYAHEYAPSNSLFINNYPYTLRRGIVFHIAETGVIGLFLFMMFVICLYKPCRDDLDIKYLFIYVFVMYMFLTNEAIAILQILILVLLSNCASDIKKEIESN